MAENIVLLDTGVLIDHIRSQKKETTFFYRLNEQYSLTQPLDIFIAAVALANDLPIATLNTSHFKRIPDLIIV